MPFSMKRLVQSAVRGDCASAEGVKVIEDPSGSACTAWKGGKVVGIQAPLGLSAYERTLRLHELLHANKGVVPGNLKFHEEAVNAVDDAIIHTVHWDKEAMPAQANRDCLSIGLLEGRYVDLTNEGITHQPERFNAMLTSAVRSIAISNTLGSDAHKEALQNRLKKFVPGTMLPLLNRVVDLAQNHRKVAIKLLHKLMMECPADDEQPVQVMCRTKPKGSDGDQVPDPMKIVRLPLVKQCSTEYKKCHVTLGRSGPRLNRPALARVIATKSPACAFRRVRYTAHGGSCVIDGSGSMSFSNGELKKLCESAPGATVAYYDGYASCERSDDGYYGELVIYAQGGKRADAIPTRHGENKIDLYALRWLLNQPGPRFFVTDRGFCGGPRGQDDEAQQLLDQSIEDGSVTWIDRPQDIAKAFAAAHGQEDQG